MGWWEIVCLLQESVCFRAVRGLQASHRGGCLCSAKDDAFHALTHSCKPSGRQKRATEVSLTNCVSGRSEGALIYSANWIACSCNKEHPFSTFFVRALSLGLHDATSLSFGWHCAGCPGIQHRSCMQFPHFIYRSRCTAVSGWQVPLRSRHKELKPVRIGGFSCGAGSQASSRGASD